MQIPFRFGIPIAALQPARAIRNIKCPVLVIAGSRDLHTHLTESKLLFGNAPNPKRLWIVEGAGHEDMYAFAGIEYERVVSKFLKSTGVEVPNKSFQVNP